MRYVFFLILTSIGNIFIIDAQRLPNKQEASIRAPANIKIDGKITEWGDKFQAHNQVSRVFYTVSNDDDNLYLALSTDDEYGFSKVLLGGITFNVKLPLEKIGNGSREIKNIAITYPTQVKPLKGPIIDRANAVKGFIINNDTSKIAAKKKLDSLILIINDKLSELFKEVKVDGVPNISDPLISIYNTDGIKVSARYNNRLQYVYELAIPLKYLGDGIKNGEKFKYNIRLNGKPENPNDPTFTNPMASLGPDNLYVDSPTDFWGEYSLVKAP